MTPGPSTPSCIHCADWGCNRCRSPLELAVARGGEQGPDMADLLRDQMRELTNKLEAEETWRRELAKELEQQTQRAEAIVAALRRLRERAVEVRP